MTRDNVDDIVASVEDAVRRAYALGRADAMKRVVELAQSDDPGLRAMALLGHAEPARPAPPPALLDAPQSSLAQPLPEHEPLEAHEVHAHEQAADAADDRHEARQDASAAEPAPAPQPAMAGQPEREPPASVGEFLADFFYPIGSKKR
ncbi:MAG TPA: hypothetical protein VGC15_15695 [Acetobacteraceae bacterium]